MSQFASHGSNSGPFYGSPSVIVNVGEFAGVYLDGFWYDCYGRGAGITHDLSTVQASDPKVAESSLGGEGLMTTEGKEVGNTLWYSNEYYYWQWFDDGMDCYNFGGNTTASGPVDVRPEIKNFRDEQDITGTTQDVVIVQKINLSATVTGGTVTNRQWEIPGNKISSC